MEENAREEQKLRMEKEQLARENATLQHQLAQSQAGGPNEAAFESMKQRNNILKSEISELQTRLQREQEMQRNSLTYQEQRVREYEDKIRQIEGENNQLKNNLGSGINRDDQLRNLVAENKSLKDQLFAAGDQPSIDMARVIQENAQLKADLSEMEKMMAALRLEKERLERGSQGGNGKSEKLLREMRRLNEDNVTLYDDNKILMRQNQQLKSEINELRGSTANKTDIQSYEASPISRKMQEDLNALHRENASLVNELSAMKSRMTTEPRTANNEQYINQLRNELAAKDREIGELRPRNLAMESTVRGLQSEVKGSHDTIRDLQDQIRNVTLVLNQREEDLRRASQAGSGISPQVQQLLKSREDENVALSKAKMDLESRMGGLESENRNLRSNNELLKSQLTSFSQTQSAANTENLNLRNRVTDLEKQLVEVSRRTGAPNDSLMKEKEYLEKELDKKVQRERRIESELTKLRNEVEMLINERDNFKRKAKDTDTHRDQINRLEQENNDLKIREANNIRTNPDLVTQMRQKDLQIEGLNRALNEANTKLQLASRDIELLNHQKQRTLSDPYTKELETKISQLASENAKMRFDLETQQKADGASYQNKYLIDDLNRKVSGLEMERSRLEQQVIQKSTELSNSENTRLNNQREIESARNHSALLQTRLQQLEDERNELLRATGQPGASSHQLEALKAENGRLLERLNTINSELSRSRDVAAGRESEISRSVLEQQRKEFEIQRLSSELDRAREELANANRMKDKVQGSTAQDEKLLHLKSENNELREKIIKLERANLDKDIELSNRKKLTSGIPEKDNFASEKGHQSGQFLFLQTQLLELKQENGALESKIAILKQENENLARIAKERLIELENIKVTALLNRSKC